MNERFSKANKVMSVLLVAFGIAFLTGLIGTAKGATSLSRAIGVAMIVYGILRYIMYTRLDRREP